MVGEICYCPDWGVIGQCGDGAAPQTVETDPGKFGRVEFEAKGLCRVAPVSPTVARLPTTRIGKHWKLAGGDIRYIRGSRSAYE